VDKTRTKIQGVVIGLVLLLVVSLVFGYVTEFDDHIKLTSQGKGLMFTYNSEEIWIYPHEWDSGEYGRTLKIPLLAYGAGNFLTTDSDGALVFVSTAPYYGDITSVWNDNNGDVSALVAISGDTLNASGADSTIPWKVSTTASPTTEGMAIWKSDSDYLAIGNGSSTSIVVMTASNATLADLTITSPSNIYSLSHDSFVDFATNEHIDWTNATNSLKTTGTGEFGDANVAGDVYCHSDVNVTGDLYCENIDVNDVINCEIIDINASFTAASGSVTTTNAAQILIEDSGADAGGGLLYLRTSRAGAAKLSRKPSWNKTSRFVPNATIT